MGAPADRRRRGGGISWRIRAYIAVLAFRLIGFAVAIKLDAEAVGSSSVFRYLFKVGSPTTWAIAHALIGIACIGGAVFPREKGIRALVTLSVGLSSAWATGAFLAMVVRPRAPGLLAVVAFVTFVAKDLIVAGMVYVNPIEKLVEGVRADEVEAAERRRRRGMAS